MQPRKLAGASGASLPAPIQHNRCSRTGARPSLSNGSQRAWAAARCAAIHSAFARCSPQRSSGEHVKVLRRVRPAELTSKDRFEAAVVKSQTMDGRSDVFDLKALQANGGSTKERSRTNAKPMWRSQATDGRCDVVY